MLNDGISSDGFSDLGHGYSPYALHAYSSHIAGRRQRGRRYVVRGKDTRSLAGFLEHRNLQSSAVYCSLASTRFQGWGRIYAFYGRCGLPKISNRADSWWRAMANWEDLKIWTATSDDANGGKEMGQQPKQTREEPELNL